MENKHILIFVGVVVVIVGIIVAVMGGGSTTADPQITTLAQCIKDSGATFYGAFWCPHCQATKKLFGAAAKELPYVECSTADGRGQNQICTDKGIQGYPTWVFADGSRESGELSLGYLAQKTNCPLPSSATVTEIVPNGTSTSQSSPAVSASSTPQVATSTRATSTLR